jgi:hypothetical protein
MPSISDYFRPVNDVVTSKPADSNNAVKNDSQITAKSVNDVVTSKPGDVVNNSSPQNEVLSPSEQSRSANESSRPLFLTAALVSIQQQVNALSDSAANVDQNQSVDGRSSTLQDQDMMPVAGSERSSLPSVDEDEPTDRSNSSFNRSDAQAVETVNSASVDRYQEVAAYSFAAEDQNPVAKIAVEV